jgi:hypothetical protein
MKRLLCLVVVAAVSGHAAEDDVIKAAREQREKETLEARKRSRLLQYAENVMKLSEDVREAPRTPQESKALINKLIDKVIDERQFDPEQKDSESICKYVRTLGKEQVMLRNLQGVFENVKRDYSNAKAEMGVIPDSLKAVVAKADAAISGKPVPDAAAAAPETKLAEPAKPATKLKEYKLRDGRTIKASNAIVSGKQTISKQRTANSLLSILRRSSQSDMPGTADGKNLIRRIPTCS